MLVQAHHRDASPERLDCEDRFTAQSGYKVHEVSGDVTARHVDEIELFEHGGL
jgi:hypothetical protein